MIQFFSDIVGAAIIHFSEGSLVGVVKDVIIDPDTGKLEGFWVKPVAHPFAYGVLQAQDIVEWKKNIYVRKEDAIADPADLIRISEILAQNRLIMGSFVRTESGVHWGRVVNIDFDTTHGYLHHLYVQKTFLGIWAYQKRVISYDAIVEVLPDFIIVKDETLKTVKAEPAILKKEEALMDG